MKQQSILGKKPAKPKKPVVTTDEPTTEGPGPKPPTPPPPPPGTGQP